MDASETKNQTVTTVNTPFEPIKIVQPCIITQNQRGSPCHVEQILKSRQSGPSMGAKPNMEWRPNTCDMWVQCEICKKWHMLPDESDPVTLPEKW